MIKSVFNQDETNILKLACEVFPEKQMIVLLEENNELIEPLSLINKHITKRLRKDLDLEDFQTDPNIKELFFHLAEEMADVMLCVSQHYPRFQELVVMIYEQKLKRLAQRINEKICEMEKEKEK